MKFYEVKQKVGSHQWISLAFFRKWQNADKYEELYNTKVELYPTKILEHEFNDSKDFEDELES